MTDVETKAVTEESKGTIEEETKKVESSPEKKKGGDEKEQTKEKESSGKDEKESGGKGEVTPAPPPPPRVHFPDFQKDAVYMYQFNRTPVLPSLSPYCLKVEAYLRLYGLKYQNVDHKLKYRSSKGQLPFVELNGEEIADSTVIISKLNQHFGVDPDANLTKEEKNVSHALISMIENHLCWVYVYWRSKYPDAMIKGCKLNLQHALGSRIPNAVLNVIFKLTYSRKGAKKVKAHGLGVHTPEEVFEFGKQDLKVLEETIGQKDYFFGEKPSNLDLVAFAHLSQIAYVDKCVEYDLRDWMLESCPNLMGLMNRMKDNCYPDWDDILSSLKMNTHMPELEEEAKKDAEKEPVKETEGEKEPKEKGEEIKQESEKKEEVKEEETK